MFNLLFSRLSGEENRDFLEYFQILHYTGFRGMEVLEVKSWRKKGASQWEVKAHKRGISKILEVSEPAMAQIIERRNGQGFNFSFSTARNIFNQKSGLSNYSMNKKRCSLHLFRHQFVKRKSLEGLNNTEIAKLLGLKNVEVVERYLNSSFTIL